VALQSNNTSLPPESRVGGIENRNFLSPIGFRFSISKMPGVDFFCQAASIPQLSCDPVPVGSTVNKYYMPGDELGYEALYVKFLIDENMKNYYQCHDWMRKIATPYSQKEFTYQRKKVESFWRGLGDDEDWKSDCSLTVLSSNYRPVAEFVFKDCFPISLSTLNFDSTVSEINYFTAEVGLRYDYFDYLIGDAAYITDESMVLICGLIGDIIWV
jgi:hypothetical protein